MLLIMASLRETKNQSSINKSTHQWMNDKMNDWIQLRIQNTDLCKIKANRGEEDLKTPAASTVTQCPLSRFIPSLLLPSTLAPRKHCSPFPFWYVVVTSFLDREIFTCCARKKIFCAQATLSSQSCPFTHLSRYWRSWFFFNHASVQCDLSTGWPSVNWRLFDGTAAICTHFVLLFHTSCPSTEPS